ncbi:ATP-binding protein [Streptomyces chrestomyceticus]|uniref:sensor histidine kinase n=1 Tax=Streptomyces chrestomyceticus TaxID=68185 RepID=UPI0033E03AC4
MPVLVPTPPTGTPAARHRAAPHTTVTFRALTALALVLIVGFATWLSAPLAVWKAMAWCVAVAGAVVVVLVTVMELRVDRISRERREACARAARLQGEVARVRDEVRWVGARLLPEVLRRLEQRESARTILERLDAEHALPEDQEVRDLVEAVVTAVCRERRERDGAVDVLRTCASGVQTGVTALLALLSDRARPYQDGRLEVITCADVLEDFNALDARLSRLGRHSQALLALTDARTVGRRWPRPIEVERIVRAAVGQNEGHQRVRWSIPQDARHAVHARAVNAAIHTTSVLIDNALRYSPPNTQVSVSVIPLAAGLSIRVEDSGLGLPPETHERVARTVDLDRCPRTFAELSGAQLGLASARKAAERFSMRIAFGISHRLGGTEASVLIPWEWVTAVPADRPSPPAAPPQQLSAASEHPSHPLALPPADEHPPAASPPPPSGSGLRLPVRRRGATLPSPRPQTTADAEVPLRPDTGRRMGAWRAAVRPVPPCSPSTDTPETSA